jgi:hypothetical protein
MYSIPITRHIRQLAACAGRCIINSARCKRIPFACWLALLVLICAGITANAQSAVPAGQAVYRAAILGAMPPLTTAEDALLIAAMLKRSGVEATILSPVQAADAGFLTPGHFPLLIVPHSERFPAMAVRNVESYLQNRGRVLFLDGPSFSMLCYPSAEGTEWMPLSGRIARLPAQAMPGLSWKNDAPFSSWLQAADSPETVITPLLNSAVSPDGTQQTLLQIHVDRYRDWFSVGPPEFKTSPFAPGAVILSFFARGDETTGGFTIECVEKDGSRWIAAVPLNPQWRKVTLRPEDFRYWPDSKVMGRGSAQDRFNPAALAFLRLGIARSHLNEKPGPHTFCLSEMGCSALPADLTGPLPMPPVLEGVSPLYKAVHDTVTGGWVPPLRDRGVGTSGEREARLRPARVPGELEAYPAAVGAYANWVRSVFAGKNAGAVWGGASVPKRENGHLTPDLLKTIAAVMQIVSIRNGGFDAAVYRAGDTPQPACFVANNGTTAEKVILRERVYGGKLERSKETTLEAVPGESRKISGIAAEAWPEGEYRYEARLYDGTGKVLVDRVEMPLRIVAQQPAAAPDAARVHVEDGEFVADGKPFRPVGVNFWPLSVAGQDTAVYARGWLSPDQYDPDVVEQDLARCQSAGINLVSIQYGNEMQAPSVTDFIRRCRNHHILVNVFVANADPRFLNAGSLNRMLDAAQLTKCADLFAFDVAWEPHLGNAQDRSRYDANWQRWITVNYGNVEAAEQQWEVKCPRGRSGLPTTPSDQQLAEDGPWRRLVAAYRRFVDEMIGAGYRNVAAVLHPRDAMIGARSGYGGNGFPGVDPQMPFDLTAGAAHLDFISPEGYGLSGEWAEYRAGGFTAAYARWAGNGAPVFWAEFGSSIYPGGDQDAERLASQADAMDKMLRMTVDSGSNGSAVWWLPGGLRIDEGSDYGIFNPDGTPRPSALRLRKYADQELPASRPGKAADSAVVGDRDEDARGFTGLRQKLKSRYLQLKEQGKTVEFKTPGTGTNTGTMPLTAVGGMPANGHNPLRYAQAELSVDPENPNRLKALNTGEAVWLSRRDENGQTALLIYREDGTLAAELPLKAPCARYSAVSWSLSDLRKLVPGKFHARMGLRRTDTGASGPGWIPFGEQTPEI